MRRLPSTRWTTSGCCGCWRTGSPIRGSSGLSGCGSRPASSRAASGTRQKGGRRRGRASVRSWPTSSCITPSISGSIIGVAARSRSALDRPLCRRLCATTARRGGSYVTPTRCSLAAQEMRVGPSDSDCRIRVQTTASCSGPMAGVVSVAEKAGSTRQVCAGKTNASEPLLTCRKRRDVAETRLQLLAWDEARRVPADCSSGDRHEDVNHQLCKHDIRHHKRSRRVCHIKHQ